MNTKLVTVVIPIYKTNLSVTEKASLEQCVKVLGSYDLVFIQPESLDSSAINFDGKISVERFPDRYFKTLFGYNELMLSHEFYQRFSNKKYMLLYQLDAFVFRDELKKWCDKGYDYIGAPWIASKETFVKKVLMLFDSKKKKERSKIFFKVGNGGFSLRNIEKSIIITQELKELIKSNLKRDKNDFLIMEDIFWSITVPKYYSDFKIPEYKEALGFAIDRKPDIALRLNNNELPFGCHGFDKPKVKDFWEKIFKNSLNNNVNK